MDDGLISVPTEVEAIQLISEARQLCSAGKLRIHKFVSNSEQVLASLQDVALGEPQIERALDVKWCVASDQFQFRVVVNERPLSRRGVFSSRQ